MRNLLTLFAIAIAATFAVSAQQPSASPRELFERARMIEESNNRLTDAIALYTQVAQSPDRQLAATAQLRIGLLHERLGQKDEAQRAFRAIVERYADYPDAARQARARLESTIGSVKSISSRRVWAGPDAQFFGSPSPDGRYLSIIDWGSGGVALRDLAAGTHRVVVPKPRVGGGNGLYSRIAPNGGEIAFTWFEADGTSELRSVRTDTAKVDVLFSNRDLAYVQPFDWSVDGQQILVLLGRPDRTHQIAIVSRATKSVRVLKTLDWRQPRGMSFSPDSRSVVYDFPTAEDRPERDIYLLAADGTRHVPIVAHPDNDFVLGWVPNSRHLLFASDRTGSNGIWSVEIVDGRAAVPPALVRADLGPRLYPLGFSRTGAFYYYTSVVVSDVYTAELDSDGRVVSAPASVSGRYDGANEEAEWSPDGRTLAVARQPTGMGGKRLVIKPADGGDERELRPAVGIFSWPRWSPDGRSIMVSGRDAKARPGFFRVDIGTGAATELLRPDEGARNLRPEWTADGMGIFYVRKNRTCSCVVRRQLADGAETDIYRMPPSDQQVRVAPSPDGRSVAVLSAEGGRPALRVVPATGGDARILYDGSDLAWLTFVAWTPDSASVLFGRAKAGVEVWRVPAAGGEPRRLDIAMPGLRNLRMAADGRRLVFTGGENKDEVWVMENYLPAPASASAARSR
jgi:Tol biopolymer transport system component